MCCACVRVIQGTTAATTTTTEIWSRRKSGAARKEIRVGIGNRVPNCAWDKEADFGRVKCENESEREKKSEVVPGRHHRGQQG